MNAAGTGASRLEGKGWRAQVLTAPPLIAPARQYTFPFHVAGEEDALARGALWLEVRTEGEGAWLAQCALGFAGTGVAHGLWPLPAAGELLVCAGGYAYALRARVPEATVLLPARPAVAVLPVAGRTALVTHHAVVVRESDGEVWTSPRLSWETVTVTAAEGERLHGTGWNMVDDTEYPFTLDLQRRTATGGGYRPGSVSGAESPSAW